MNAEDRALARIADADPAAASERPPEEAERVMHRVLAAQPSRSGPRGLALVISTSVAVAVAVLAVALLGRGGVAPSHSQRPVAPSGSFTLVSPAQHGHPPAISVPPGMLTLASLGMREGHRWFIYGQRIRFEGRLYFCLFLGNRDGSSQACVRWPLAYQHSGLLTGGFSPTFALAAAIVPRGARCTIRGFVGRPRRMSAVRIPASLKVGDEVVYAFVTFPGKPVRAAPGAQFLGVTGSGRVSCRR